ncbi:MAG: glutaconyl-CoA/methylmalonyl-CoA decarboxylase subunit delta [Candidatus Sumerlaeota bacterium]|nr:glutaconyl-CoA/methylmalonyl-CoA decarboxylase subunit delta [Candidatus Sumerlaeota bacterium]
MSTMLTATASPLLAAATSNGDIGQGVMLMFMGMGLVFTALAILMIILMIMRATIGSETAAPAPAAAPAPPPPATPATDNGIDPETVAVLTAAAIAVVRAPIRLKSVTFIRHDGGKDWASHGRAAIHTSHRLRKGK